MSAAPTPEEIRTIQQEADCLYDQRQVGRALDDMARTITARLGEKNPLLLCVMSGALIPAGHLLTRLDFPLEIDYIHATRYGGATSGGELHWFAEPHESLRDRVVLVVDDILDEGITLAAILEHCRHRGVRELYSAVLVEKQHQRKNGLAADFVGLTVPDRYVFGYGMDYKGYLRNAPGIYAVKGM